jgi:hypothetical protein
MPALQSKEMAAEKETAKITSTRKDKILFQDLLQAPVPRLLLFYVSKYKMAWQMPGFFIYFFM